MRRLFREPLRLAQHHDHEPAGTLEELESLGVRLAQWVGANPALVLGGAVLILTLAAAAGGYRAYVGSRTERASVALSTLQAELVVAMGGKATDADVPEPANPETARNVRTQFADRYLALAKDWKGTPTGALALLEAGELFEQLGNTDRALEAWSEALGAAPAGSPTLGILHTRIGHVQEDKGDFEAAAKSYEAAAAIPGYPLIGGALADAARCWAEAGKDEAALAISKRLKTELPDYQLPPYVASRLAEIELRAGVVPTPPGAPEPPAAPAQP